MAGGYFQMWFVPILFKNTGFLKKRTKSKKPNAQTREPFLSMKQLKVERNTLVSGLRFWESRAKHIAWSIYLSALKPPSLPTDRSVYLFAYKPVTINDYSNGVIRTLMTRERYFLMNDISGSEGCMGHFDQSFPRCGIPQFFRLPPKEIIIFRGARWGWMKISPRRSPSLGRDSRATVTFFRKLRWWKE